MTKLSTVLFGVLISLAIVSQADADDRGRRWPPRRDGRDYRYGYGYGGFGYYQPRYYYQPPVYYPRPYQPRLVGPPGIPYQYYDPYRGTYIYYRW